MRIQIGSSTSPRLDFDCFYYDISIFSFLFMIFVLDLSEEVITGIDFDIYD